MDLQFLREKLISRSLLTPAGCLEWQGARDPKGYGRVGVGKETYLVHRIAWQVWTGEDPGALCVLHRCDNPPCFSQEHLFLGTPKDNSQDMAMKGRGANQNTMKTHCVRGHSLHDAYITARNKRVCRQCSLDLYHQKKNQASRLGEWSLQSCHRL